MPRYFAIYGFEFTREISLGSMTLHPRTANSSEASELARDEHAFHLTGIGRIPKGAAANLFDLEGALTFCEQRWVVLSHVRSHESEDSAIAMTAFADALDLLQPRPSHGAAIIADALNPKSREEFLSVCLSKLQDQAFDRLIDFRRAFFRDVEIWKLRTPALDLTYYLAFSALEILARAAVGREKHAAEAIAEFLCGLGFDVKQDMPSAGKRSIQRYATLRNRLFHNGDMETTVVENGTRTTLRINEYEGPLLQLLADALIAVLDYDDGHINWDRWFDRQAFRA